MPKKNERSCMQQIIKFIFTMINTFHIPIAVVFYTDKGFKVIGSRKLRNKLRSDIEYDSDSYTSVLNEELTSMANFTDRDYQNAPPFSRTVQREEEFQRLPFKLKYLKLDQLRSLIGKFYYDTRYSQSKRCSMAMVFFI